LDLCDINGEFTWAHAKFLGLSDKDFIHWAGIINSIPKEWKTYFKQHGEIETLKKQIGDCLTLNNKKVTFEKINTADIYQQIVISKFKTPTSQKHLISRISPGENISIDWKTVYGRIYKTTIDTYLRMFQYKILNNILYLNRDLCRFKLISYASCSFCKIHPETIDHLFVYCIKTKNLYFEIRDWLEKFDLFLPESNTYNIILGVDDLTINFVILMFKLILFKKRENEKIPNIGIFALFLKSFEIIERKAAQTKNNMPQHLKKWQKLQKAIQFH
jgi:hypothetical protein